MKTIIPAFIYRMDLGQGNWNECQVRNICGSAVDYRELGAYAKQSSFHKGIRGRGNEEKDEIKEIQSIQLGDGLAMGSKRGQSQECS